MDIFLFGFSGLQGTAFKKKTNQLANAFPAASLLMGVARVAFFCEGHEES